MATEQEMRKEIIAAIKYPELTNKVLEELNVLSKTDGLDNKPLLERFYKIWKSSTDKIGHENKINSWTAYAIGMTIVKPQDDQPFLPKRRVFARAGFPDIDTDFDYARRSEVYRYIIEKYGQEQVGNIGTYAGIKMKSYIRRSVKSLDPTKSFFKYNPAHIIQAYTQGKAKINKEWEKEANAKADEIVKSLPHQWGAILKIKDENGVEHDIKTVKDAYEWCPEFAYYMDQYPDILQHSHNIEGLLSVYGVHPAGIVVSDVPLSSVAPLRQTKIHKENEDGEMQVVFATQYANEDLETLGLIKFDALALSTLTIIDNAIKEIKNRYGIVIDLKNINLDDEKTFDLYRSGNLTGVFQAEEDGMQHAFMNIGCNRFEDIVAIVALYRPGPLASIPSYAARKKGQEPIEYFHESFKKYLEPYLKDTYGILCIHEDTLVSMSDGTLKPIKEIKKGDKVISVNEERFTEVKECDGCAPTVYGEGFKVELENGYSIVLTGNHKIMTFDGMKPVSEIDIHKDIIACPSNMRFQYKNENFFGDWLGDPRDVCYLLGLLLADGNINTGSNLCCGSLENANKIEKWIAEKIPKLKVHKYFHTRSWYLGLSCDELVNWRNIGDGNRKTKWHSMLESLGMKENCYNKRIPKQILSSSDSIIRQAFLAGMIDGDGCIYINKRGITCCNYTSASNELLQDLRQLLSSLSISCSLTKNKIHINDTKSLYYLINHLLIIKTLPDKCFSDGLRSSKIPLSLLKSFIVKSGLSEREFCNKYKISRANIRKNRDFVSLYVVNKIEDLKYIHDRDIKFYKIKSIEKVENQQFYDMSVRDNHNLVGNGIVISNCYQEQVMQICQSLAGFTVSEGYDIIKAVGKKVEVLLKKYEDRFIDGCVQNGLDRDLAKKYWSSRILPFASYGFNKSHSAAYGFLSYQTAYLKANYPEIYMCCYLNVEMQRAKHEKVEVLEQEVRRMGIEVLPRSINKCKMEYEISAIKDVSAGIPKSQIRPSIMCKGLAWAAAENIVANQKYKDLRDFAERTDPKVVDKSSVEALLEAGFFDGDREKKKLLENFRVIREDLKKARNKGVDLVDIFT